ncbi:MAG: hypothetical protein LBJ92_01505 [Holosporales bacterium]|jgi:hypothetical protein|nr:hypothetical protein [Holosporales bacterium]
MLGIISSGAEAASDPIPATPGVIPSESGPVPLGGWTPNQEKDILDFLYGRQPISTPLFNGPPIEVQPTPVPDLRQELVVTHIEGLEKVIHLQSQEQDVLRRSITELTPSSIPQVEYLRVSPQWGPHDRSAIQAFVGGNPLATLLSPTLTGDPVTVKSTDQPDCLVTTIAGLIAWLESIITANQQTTTSMQNFVNEIRAANADYLTALREGK